MLRVLRVNAHVVNDVVRIAMQGERVTRIRRLPQPVRRACIHGVLCERILHQHSGPSRLGGDTLNLFKLAALVGAPINT